MKRSCFYTFLAVLLVVFLLSGCQWPPKVITVTKYKTIVLSPPVVLAAVTPVPLPQDPKLYLAAGWAERAQLNANQTVVLYKALGQCNADKASLREWSLTETARYATLRE